MSLKLMYITNKSEIAEILEETGVDRAFIDLEVIGKETRQGHLDTVISRHYTEDIRNLRRVLHRTELLVRTNPIHQNSKAEIDEIVANGADILMLPYFKTAREVETFINFVGKRAVVCLLLETKEAVDCVDEILELKGIDEIHIGLNDLHLSYNMNFLFELLVDGTVERLCEKFKTKGIPYGFGGIAKLGCGALPAEHIIAQHYYFGSGMAILSRSFCNTNDITDLAEIKETFKTGVAEIRNFEKTLADKDKEFFTRNNQQMAKIIRGIVSEKDSRRNA